jgi:hypothetical protein
LFNTCDTVPSETPAIFAICFMFAMLAAPAG